MVGICRKSCEKLDLAVVRGGLIPFVSYFPSIFSSFGMFYLGLQKGWIFMTQLAQVFDASVGITGKV